MTLWSPEGDETLPAGAVSGKPAWQNQTKHVGRRGVVGDGRVGRQRT
jgi:hypothetical protein